MRPWIKYTLIRIVLFAGVLAIMMLFTPAPLWLSPVVAAVVGLCVSYIFFRPQRDQLAESIALRRARGELNADEDEDDALDGDGDRDRDSDSDQSAEVATERPADSV